jgi:hypothetical protein
MAGREPRPRLRFLAGKAGGAARIHDLMVGGAEDLAHELLVRDRSAVERGGEMGVADLRLAPFHRAPFGFPFLQAAVEDRDIMRAEALQHPPGAGRAVQRRIVVDDEALPVAQPERLHPARELVLGRQHVRRRVRRVDDLVEVHEHGARDMLRLIFRARVAAVRGEEHGRVDRLQIGSAEFGGQPIGRDERVHPVPPSARRLDNAEPRERLQILRYLLDGRRPDCRGKIVPYLLNGPASVDEVQRFVAEARPFGPCRAPRQERRPRQARFLEMVVEP